MSKITIKRADVGGHELRLCVQLGGAERLPTDYVFDGSPTGTHSLSCDHTCSRRLSAHWTGYVDNACDALGVPSFEDCWAEVDKLRNWDRYDVIDRDHEAISYLVSAGIEAAFMRRGLRACHFEERGEPLACVTRHRQPLADALWAEVHALALGYDT